MLSYIVTADIQPEAETMSDYFGVDAEFAYEETQKVLMENEGRNFNEAIVDGLEGGYLSGPVLLLLAANGLRDYAEGVSKEVKVALAEKLIDRLFPRGDSNA